jgi:hypothetical protein
MMCHAMHINPSLGARYERWDNAYGFPCWCPRLYEMPSEIETKIIPIELGVDSKHK